MCNMNTTTTTLTDIKIGNGAIKLRRKFRYFDSIIDDKGTCDADIHTRIALGKRTIKATHSLLLNTNMRTDVKKRESFP